MEGQRATLLFVLTLLFILSRDNGSPSNIPIGFPDDRVQREQQALAYITNSSYNHLAEPRSRSGLNSSELSSGDHISWDLLPEVQRSGRIQYLELFGGSEEPTWEDDITGSERAYELASKHALPLYRNITGTVQGSFVRREIPIASQRTLNYIKESPQTGSVVSAFRKNITDSKGQISLRISEDQKNHDADTGLQGVLVDLAVQTESSPGTGWEKKLLGLHNPHTGSVVLTSNSGKFSGSLNLPFLALSRHDYSDFRLLLERKLNKTIYNGNHGKSDDSFFPLVHSSVDTSTNLFQAPSCEYIVYLQQQPISVRTTEKGPQLLNVIKNIEKELRFPTGRNLPPIPPLLFTGLVFSPDCGFVLEIKPNTLDSGSNILSGPKQEVHWSLARRLVFAVMIVLCLQIALLRRQMDEASTPSVRSRTSYHSVGLMITGDIFMMSILIACSMLSDIGFLILAAAGFFCFFNFTFLEMKFIYDIWMVQDGARTREQRPQTNLQQASTVQQDSPASVAINRPGDPSLSGTDPTSSGLPLPVTAPRPADTGATPIILPPDQDIEMAVQEDEIATTTRPGTPAAARMDFHTLYSRFYVAMVVLGLFSLWAFSWPKSYRVIYVNALSFGYLSFWVPQIYRNAMRNCRQAFTWEYTIGISILRLVPVFYCYNKSENTLGLETESVTGFVFAAWVLLQVLALAIQQFLGPRLFVKESWCPPAYEYHPLLQDAGGDVESGSLLPIGFVASASEAKEKKDEKERDSNNQVKIFDCAICMNEIEAPVVPSDESGERRHLSTNWLGRRVYMVTPCRHIFHTECLEGWMRFRLVCPICRESLPPL